MLHLHHLEGQFVRTVKEIGMREEMVKCLRNHGSSVRQAARFLS